MESDFAYFKRRANEERAAAMSAANLQARKSHLELARRHEEVATALSMAECKLSFVSSGIAPTA